MKKTHMILYTAAVIGFYISRVMLYLNTLSITGTALLCLSILTLGAGVFFQWKEANHKGSWVSSEAPQVAAKATVSC